MAVGDTISGEVRVRPIETVPADATVRHFDELSDREQARLIAIVDGAGDRLPNAGLFEGVDVVVYTDYLRIERA